MHEPWKAILCDSEKCISEMFVPENMKVQDNRLTDEAIQKFKIGPDLDTTYMTTFKCPRCGKVTTWGITRRDVAKILYERYKDAGLDPRTPRS